MMRDANYDVNVFNQMKLLQQQQQQNQSPRFVLATERISGFDAVEERPYQGLREQ